MHAFAVQRLPKQCNQALKWCSNCCNCFITFAQFSSLMCYHYWFSFCKGFCKLCKRLTLENMSHFLCISKFWLLTNEGHNQILKKCWKAEDIKSKKYNCPVICNNCCVSIPQFPVPFSASLKLLFLADILHLRFSNWCQC